MNIRVALAGNPNSGKTTLFNTLTGSNQFVGNWPGVTVERKTGKLRKHDDVEIVDLPGIYSLSPYTLEEVVARKFLIDEKPEVILNIIDGTNIERNLYLTTQLLELGIPLVLAINMADIVEKNGDIIKLEDLEKELNCPIVEISALKGSGIDEVTNKAIKLANLNQKPNKIFSQDINNILKDFENYLTDIPENEKYWYSIKLFERDEEVLKKLNLNQNQIDEIEEKLSALEDEYDDDTESIITDQRYDFIGKVLNNTYKKQNKGELTLSDKIDRVVTNRWLALPIFALVMFCVYFISVTTVGSWCTDFVNDGVFGDGFFFFGTGREAYEIALEDYDLAQTGIEAFDVAAQDQGLDPASAKTLVTSADLYDEEGNVEEIIPVTYQDYIDYLKVEEPDPSNYGLFIPGVPVLLQNWLESVHCAQWLQSLILDGIVAGVGAVLGFVPQIFVLFFLLAFLESCGYMARVAFVMDRIFRKFGLSGKSFIPMLIGTGCGVPGIMASRTIENERDRRMTIITTTFIPCSAKLPIIALIAGALLGGAWWVAPSAYLIGAFAIVTSGIILKKTKMFAGNPAPFVMELPAYHWPTLSTLFHSMWERGWSFIKKAGTIILLATILIWFLSNFGFENGHFGLVDMDNSILAGIGSLFSFIFIPLGWGTWQATVATITGLIAKENVVGTFGVLFGGFDEVSENGWQIWSNMQAFFTPISAFSFLIFNLLCAPCFAAIGAIRREMNSAKWTWFAIIYQCVFAYIISFIIYQIGSWFFGTGNVIGTIVALILLGLFVYLLFRSESREKPIENKIDLEIG